MAARKTRVKQHGFTLIELSIVLVIIGLIAGGILVGQDLIKAATIRSSVKQLDQYNSAVNTFRDKYGALPGDVTPAKIVRFGLPDAATSVRTGSIGLGDGDGLLNACGANVRAFGCETAWLWNDLAFAQLIPDPLNNATNTPTGTAIALSATNWSSYIPKTRLRDSAQISAFNMTGRNYFLIANQISTSSSPAYASTPGVTVREANDIDSKVDDGFPRTGTVLAQISGGPAGTLAAAATPASGVCVSNATGNPYNTASNGSYMEEVNCLIAIRMQ